VKEFSEGSIPDITDEAMIASVEEIKLLLDGLYDRLSFYSELNFATDGKYESKVAETNGSINALNFVLDLFKKEGFGG